MMIAPYYHDQKSPTVEKVPSFYLPNKNQFNSSIGLDFENRLCGNKSINDEVIIFAHFCEMVGPVPLLVYPVKNNLSPEIIDKIVVKAMSVDYQCCERGDAINDTTTQALMLDCSIPFFVHYFTLWDIDARGFVRPCCIIVCCRDKIRARELFITKYSDVCEILKPKLIENINYFYQELVTKKDRIGKIILLYNEGKLLDEKDCNYNYLTNLFDEFDALMSNIIENNSLEPQKNLLSGDFLFDVNEARNEIKRELRSIYNVMKITETEILNLLVSISKVFNNAAVSEDFCLPKSDFSLHFPARSHYSKCNIQFYGNAFTIDKNFLFMDKFSPLCLCRTILSNLNVDDKDLETGDIKEIIFPNMLNIKASQCYYVSHQCTMLSVPIVIKLVSSLFNQFHLVVFVNNQQSYYSFMNFLLFFLPVRNNINYIPSKNEWPTVDSLNEFPVTMLNKHAVSSEIPPNLQGLIIVYDYTANQFLYEPKYSKGHIINFFDSFKYLDFNHMHLEPLVNILLLNYVDMIYQWTTIMAKRDRRWITEDYLVRLGYSQEDITISEKLTLYIIQTLVKSKPNTDVNNAFLTCSGVYSILTRKDLK